MLSLQGSSCTIDEYLVTQHACFAKEKKGNVGMPFCLRREVYGTGEDTKPSGFSGGLSTAHQDNDATALK